MVGCDELCLNELSYWGATELSKLPSGCWVDGIFSSFSEPKDERPDSVPDPRVPDPTVMISSLSSMVDSSEQTDRAALEFIESRLDLSLTLLHQLCSDSLTLSATNAFLHLDPI